MTTVSRPEGVDRPEDAAILDAAHQVVMCAVQGDAGNLHGNSHMQSNRRDRNDEQHD